MKNRLVVPLVLSVLGNCILLYRVLDLGVATTYLSDEVRRRGQQTEDARKLLSFLVTHQSRADVLDAARVTGLEVLDKGEAGVFIGSIHFIFSDDEVSTIEFD